jgi:GT2 family glycosyltransferase
MNLTVGIATSGRPELTAALVRSLVDQTRRPDQVIICPAKPGDIDDAVGEGLPYPVLIVRGEPGLPAQRNTILRAAAETDVILFFDDDFIPAKDYLELCAGLFEAHPDIVVTTGTVIADGIHDAGFTPEQAVEILARDVRPAKPALTPTYGGYGCNMAIRMAPVRANNLTFDEALPLYGWLEDIDFSRQLAPYGAIRRTELCRGVHLGVKKGRTSGVRFGYSQIANPVHMIRKGSMDLSFAGPGMLRNVLANTGKSFRPEPWVDRRGRLKGNLHAICDFVTGKLDPRKILTMD